MKFILVVEDDKSVTRAMRAAIAKYENITPSFATTATEARKKLLDGRNRFDLISIDAQFPEYSGGHKNSENTAGIDLLYFLDENKIHGESIVVFYSHNPKALKRAGNMVVNGKKVMALNKTDCNVTDWLTRCFVGK